VSTDPKHTVDARETAAKAFADATGYYVPFHAGLSSVSADKMRKGINAAIDAYLTTSQSQDPRVEEIRAIVREHHAMVAQRRSASASECRLFSHIEHLLEINSTLSAQLSAMQAERDRMKEALEDAKAVLISGCRMSPDARIIGVINAALTTTNDGGGK